MKNTNLRVLVLVLCTIMVSCTQDNNNDSLTAQELELRTALGISGKIPSNEEKEKIANNTEPIYFENVEDAKNFMSEVSKEFSFTFNNEKVKGKLKTSGYARKGGNVSVDFEDGSLMSVPCDSQILEPFDGCDDGGGDNGGQNCGSGNVLLRSGNQSISFYYNATFNYNSQGGDVSATDFNSYISGVTIGASYDQISNSHWVAMDGTINFTIRGALHYNIFVEGVGTVYTESVTLKGKYNPCGSSSNGSLDLYLQPAD